VQTGLPQVRLTIANSKPVVVLDTMLTVKPHSRCKFSEGSI